MLHSELFTGTYSFDVVLERERQTDRDREGERESTVLN